VADNGVVEYSGDGGLAVGVQLNSPRGVYVDQTGRIFIGDTFNHVIRMVDTSAIITTVAGNVFGAGTVNGGYSGDGGLAVGAKLSRPTNVFVDGIGRIFIADRDNYVIILITYCLHQL
jgi:hypothetical protein